MRRVSSPASSAMLLCLAALASACASEVEPYEFEESDDAVVYGADDRREYAAASPRLRSLADSVAVVLEKNQLRRAGDGWRIDPGVPLRDAFRDAPVCSSERFVSQPTPGNCTAFVVGSNLIATAGHCVSAASCGDVRFAFGFRMQGGRPRFQVTENEVYRCAAVVGRRNTNTDDWAVVRVDRDIRGRAPLAVRRNGSVGNRTPLVVIGHPVGLPLKIAGGAVVTDNGPGRFFEANLDTYGGNSGSPVFNARTFEVEGILVRGQEDFVPASEPNGTACYRSNVCSNGQGCGGSFEDVTRIDRILGSL